MQYDKITWPWQRNCWPEIKKIISQKINSIAELDILITSNFLKRMQINGLVNIFSEYYTNDAYEVHRVSKDHFINDIIP